MAQASSTHRSLTGRDFADAEARPRSGSAPVPGNEGGQIARNPHWAEAKAWLENAGRRIANVISVAGISASAIEAELASLVDTARHHGLALEMPRGHRTALARQIAIWFERREREAAERLTRGSLAMLIGAPKAA